MIQTQGMSDLMRSCLVEAGKIGNICKIYKIDTIVKIDNYCKICLGKVHPNCCCSQGPSLLVVKVKITRKPIAAIGEESVRQGPT